MSMQTVSRKRIRLGATRSNKVLLIIPAVGLLALFFIYPIVTILLRSFSDPKWGLQNYAAFFRESAYLGALANTFKIAVTVTVITLVLGYLVAYAMTTVGPKMKKFILIAVLIPFWTSLLVRTYAWMVLLQSEGIINRSLLYLGIIHEPLQLIHNFTGVIIGMVYTMLPFMILPIYATMTSIDQGLMRAGANLGAPPAVVFTRIFMPLTLPGVGAGSIMVFVMTIGYYITPALLGGSKDTMIGQFIAEQIQSLLNWGMGATAAVVLVTATMIFFVFYLKITSLERRAS
ncbi:ABC transporter permease [Brevibacillus sp. B_LB10_24]|uniref:ABC transporter permease n=1 Tax=Brevibacillus sp. B_LB10_24 TaxID=3380645 RepID=UPI0038B855B6